MPKPDLHTPGEESCFFSGICIWLNHNIFIFCLTDFYISPTDYCVFLHLFIAFGKESNMVFTDFMGVGDMKGI